MRTGLTRSLLAIGFVAFTGSGCDQLGPLLDALQKANGVGPRSTGTAGTSAGTSGSASGSAGTTGSAGTSGTGSMCVRITEGGPGTCEDYATYKIRSNDVCAQKNLVLSNLEPGAMCGNGGVESMTFVCCPPAPTPTPVTCSESTDATGRVCKTCVDANGKVVSTDCNSSVPGTMCEKIDGGGDSTSCKPYDIWKQYGADTCNQKNMQLTDIALGPSCGGTNYQNATYVCCATTPSGSTGTAGTTGSDGTTGGAGGSGGASGQMCTTEKLSTGTSCKSYDLWKQDAYAACQQQNLLLTSLTPGPNCDGGIVGVTFSCCGSPVPPPPPPPTCTQSVDANNQICKTCVDATGMVVSNVCTPSSSSAMCITIDDGSSSSCKDEVTWKKYGIDRCAQQNLLLNDLKLVVACSGGYSMVTYVCCGSGTP